MNTDNLVVLESLLCDLYAYVDDWRCALDGDHLDEYDPPPLTIFRPQETDEEDRLKSRILEALDFIRKAEDFSRKKSHLIARRAAARNADALKRLADD